MTFSPELLKQLVATFQAELEEGAMVLTNGLVELEKTNDDKKRRSELIEQIFRTAHNLKGASRGIGINHVGDITHHIESIFSTFAKEDAEISKEIIDVCLEAVDKMQLALQSFIAGTELDFDLTELLVRMESGVAHAGDSKPDVSAATPALKGAAVNKASKPDVVKETAKPNVVKEASKPDVKPGTDSIRVPLSLIDRLSELSEEVQVSKIMIEDHANDAEYVTNILHNFSSAWGDINRLISELGSKSDNMPLHKALNCANDEVVQLTASVSKNYNDLKTHSNDFSRLSKSIHEDVALLRLVPANSLLGLLPRYIRELSNSLGKDVNLTVVGGDVTIDKYVLEGLKDPINHILRNAIDHGIESPQERTKLGKSASGEIAITVRDAGSKVVFEISDDGNGIDCDRIKEKIVKHQPEELDKLNLLSSEEIQQYIFQPGFSTKSEVTSISGRGVGMDVVKKNIQLLKGNVSINSSSGKGTMFAISVPLSLSSERGLIVRCESNIFVIPTVAIHHVSAVTESDVISIEGCRAILNEGRPVLLKPLSAVLGFSSNMENSELTSVLILKISENQVALSVDEILGEREIVIKPIQSPLSDVSCVSGATLLDRNKIAIVLNPVDLIESSINTVVSYEISDADSIVDEGKKEALRVLVVDDSITTRTLEKNILESKNYNVTTAVNGKEAWDILQKQSFSLLITDVNMPIMDGFELTDRVKKSDKLASLPVIIITSLGSDSEKARGIEVGADAYIVKNEFESGALLQTIERLV